MYALPVPSLAYVPMFSSSLSPTGMSLSPVLAKLVRYAISVLSSHLSLCVLRKTLPISAYTVRAFTSVGMNLAQRTANALALGALRGINHFFPYSTHQDMRCIHALTIWV